MGGLRRWWREQGTVVTGLYVVHRGLQALSGGRWRIVPYRLYAQPIGRAGTIRLRPDPATCIDQLGADNPLLAALPRPSAVIAARLAAGARCHAATVKGRFAGTIWIARGHYDEDEVRCRYELAEPAISAWDYDVYVDPDFRLGRTMARLWQHVDAGLAAEGVRWSFSRISMFNPASSSSHARLGARPVGWAVFLCLGALELSAASTTPRLHVGLSSRPRYRLRAPAEAVDA